MLDCTNSFNLRSYIKKQRKFIFDSQLNCFKLIRVENNFILDYIKCQRVVTNFNCK